MRLAALLQSPPATDTLFSKYIGEAGATTAEDGSPPLPPPALHRARAPPLLARRLRLDGALRLLRRPLPALALRRVPHQAGRGLLALPQGRAPAESLLRRGGAAARHRAAPALKRGLRRRAPARRRDGDRLPARAA